MSFYRLSNFLISLSVSTVLLMLFACGSGSGTAIDAAEQPGGSKEPQIANDAPVPVKEDPMPDAGPDSSPDSNPDSGVATPDNEDPMPDNGGSTPVGEDPAPNNDDPTSITDDPTPVTNNPAPVTDDPTPVTANPTPQLDPRVNFSDCELELPCIWSSIDKGILVTLVEVTTDVMTDQLRIIYTVETTRDTKIQLLSGTSTVDARGQLYSANAPSLTSVIGSNEAGATLDLLSGIKLTVTQPFREAPAVATRSIARFALSFIEAGQSHEVGFLQLPLNTGSDEAIDCLYELPCTWVAKNGELSVSVLLADGLSNGRLVTHFRVDAKANILVNVNAGSVAIGNDGTQFKPKTHTLGDRSDYLAFETPMIADASLSGSQSYFRTVDQVATELRKMTLNIRQVGAPGMGFPAYRNVPLN